MGICDAAPFARDRAALLDREARGFRTTFEERDIDKRADPQQVLPGCRSIVAAGMSYRQAAPVPPGDGQGGPRGRLSRYCRGLDYHRVLRDRLEALAAWLRDQVPGARTVVCVDTAPPLERAIAERAGLGFFGRSTNLITRRYGTWVFLGAILTDAALWPDDPAQGTCGRCTRCLDACPTGALVEPYVLDSHRCLSYVTQMKGYVPAEFREALGDWIFGCDICQDVCPYNRRPGLAAGDHPDLAARPEVGGDAGPLLATLLRMDAAQFRAWYQPTAAGWRGRTVLQRNAVIALGNSGDPAALPLLVEALDDPRALIRGHAAWALGRLARLRPELADKAVAALRAYLEREQDPQARLEAAAALERLGGAAGAGPAGDAAPAAAPG